MILKGKYNKIYIYDLMTEHQICEEQKRKIDILAVGDSNIPLSN